MTKVREALELIAVPKRADGTYNRCREACEELARNALPELEAMERVIAAARKTEAIYWNFEKSMQTEVEALREALQALDAARETGITQIPVHTCSRAPTEGWRMTGGAYCPFCGESLKATQGDEGKAKP